MNILRIAFYLYSILIPVFAVCQQQDADAMFRANTTHNFLMQIDTTKTFTKFAWQFQTGAAIRSTAVCNNDLVFVGSSDGYLYALHKQDGKLAWKYNCGSAITA